MRIFAAPLLIGLTGAAGAGKDTAAEYLAETYGFVTLAFAAPIRDMAKALARHADLDSTWCNDRHLKEQPMPVLEHSYRELAQTLGTEWGRELIDGAMWIRIVDRKLDGALLSAPGVVITDLRFDNEAAWLKRRGGAIVRVSRESAKPVRQHVSEKGAATIECDHELYNHYDKPTLHRQLDALVATMRSGRA